MSAVEECKFVEAPETKRSLEFEDEKHQARFELGVSMLVHSWDALDIAVANSWGGPDSAEKRDWITGIVVQLFKDDKVVDAALIEETLLYAMLDEFDTNVDDGTAAPIANSIIDLYTECAVGNYSTTETLYTKWLERQSNGWASKPRLVQVNEVVSSDDDEEEEEEEEDMDVDMEEEQQQPHTVPEPVIDDDGFELVQKKGKKRY